MLLYETSMVQSIILGVLMLLANGFFALYSGIHISMDIAVTMKEKMLENEEKTRKSISDITKEGPQPGKKVGLMLRLKALIFHVLVKIFSFFAALKEHESIR